LSDGDVVVVVGVVAGVVAGGGVGVVVGVVVGTGTGGGVEVVAVLPVLDVGSDAVVVDGTARSSSGSSCGRNVSRRAADPPCGRHGLMTVLRGRS
jgi:hypothetical protein